MDRGVDGPSSLQAGEVVARGVRILIGHRDRPPVDQSTAGTGGAEYGFGEGVSGVSPHAADTAKHAASVTALARPTGMRSDMVQAACPGKSRTEPASHL